jgi:hypothetical protein
MLIPVYQTMWCYNPKESDINNYVYFIPLKLGGRVEGPSPTCRIVFVSEPVTEVGALK